MRTLVHEMRNQLAVASANIEAFIDGKLEPTPSRLKAVLQALNELDVLLNDVRTMPGPVAMRSELRLVDICSILSNEGVVVEAACREKGLTFEMHQCAVGHAGCLAFSGDPVRIGQLVKNLLLNAVRYTPSGGSVRLDCRREAGQLVFTVANSGPGIAAKHLAHIFEAGYRGSSTDQEPGTGMGLAIAKQFVEDHGGAIDVRSHEGDGATFTVRFPDAAPVDSCAGCLTELRVLGPLPVADRLVI